MKTLYLHIGSPKTATTSIQKYLQLNEEILQEHDYCFPELLHQYPVISSSRNGHFLTGELHKKTGGRDRDLEQQYRLEGMEQVEKCFEQFHHVILSDEILWRDILWHSNTQNSPQSVFPFLMEHSRQHKYQVKIIVYLRRQDDLISSYWNQKVKKIGTKHGRSFTETLEEYVSWSLDAENGTYVLDYAHRLDYLAEVFGKENLIVRRFDPNTWINGSIIDDFMHCIGMDNTEDFIPLTEKTNPGLHENTTEIKRILNKNKDFTMEEGTYFRNILLDLSVKAEAQRPRCSMLSAQEREELLKHFEADNTHIADTYVCDGKPLFSDSIKDLPKWTSDNPYMLEDVIRFFSTVTIDLRRENQALQKDLITMRAQFEKELEKERNDLRTFKYKLKHPFRALWKRIFHKNQKRN
jgi:hypothetical protein